MRDLLRTCGPPALAASVLVLALAGDFRAQHGEGAAHQKPGDAQLYDAARAAINLGADLYNKQRDYAGCYHVYHGAVVTLRPLLGHHPDLQKAIDAGLAKAAAIPRNMIWDRAFVLREVLEQIRVRTKGETPGADKKPPDDKTKPDDKAKPDDKTKPDDKAKDDKAKPDDKTKPDDKSKPDDKTKPDDKKGNGKDTATVQGKVTYKGKPLGGAVVTFVGDDGKGFNAVLDANGMYRLKGDLPAGTYKVTITPIAPKPPNKGQPKSPVPAMYQNLNTTPLVVELRKGPNLFDLDLK
jgi:hypothetical protein